MKRMSLLKNVFIISLILASLLLFLSNWFEDMVMVFSHRMYIYIQNVTAESKVIKITFTEESEAFRESLKVSDEGEVAYEIVDDVTIIPHSAKVRAKKIFNDKPMVIWATEWHMTPVKDLEILLTPFGVKFFNYNLDIWRCAWQDCKAKEKLKVLTTNNVLEVPPPIPQKFYEAYKDDPDMKTVDVVLCSYPASVCEIYIPLNKSVLVLPTTRYEVGRYTVERWNKLNENFRILAQKPWNVFGGNNLYDARYLRYYTGIETQHLPSVCDYTEAEYTNEINEYLVLRRRDRGFNKFFLDAFNNASQVRGVNIKVNIIGHYNHRDLAKYRGIIHVPYQISVMSIFEQYRMNIPMFFPSPELLARWQVDYYVMPERTFDGAFFGRRPKSSTIPPHPSQADVPDPKNEFDYNSTLYWMQFADFYQVMPHCFIYESIEHLVDILSSLDQATLQRISYKIRDYNFEFKKRILQKWKSILLNYAKNKH